MELDDYGWLVGGGGAKGSSWRVGVSESSNILNGGKVGMFLFYHITSNLKWQTITSNDDAANADEAALFNAALVPRPPSAVLLAPLSVLCRKTVFRVKSNSMKMLRISAFHRAERR